MYVHHVDYEPSVPICYSGMQGSSFPGMVGQASLYAQKALYIIP
jgi:hypothetical protein